LHTSQRRAPFAFAIVDAPACCFQHYPQAIGEREEKILQVTRFFRAGIGAASATLVLAGFVEISTRPQA